MFRQDIKVINSLSIEVVSHTDIYIVQVFVVHKEKSSDEEYDDL